VRACVSVCVCVVTEVLRYRWMSQNFSDHTHTHTHTYTRMQPATLTISNSRCVPMLKYANACILHSLTNAQSVTRRGAGFNSLTVATRISCCYFCTLKHSTPHNSMGCTCCRGFGSFDHLLMWLWSQREEYLLLAIVPSAWVVSGLCSLTNEQRCSYHQFTLSISLQNFTHRHPPDATPISTTLTACTIPLPCAL